MRFADSLRPMVGLTAFGPSACAGGAAQPSVRSEPTKVNVELPDVGIDATPPSVELRDRMIVLRAGARTRWKDALRALDGARLSREAVAQFVLEVVGDPSRRSGTLTFPRSEDLAAPLRVIELDSAGDAPSGNMVLRTPPDAPYGAVVDAVRAAHAKGAGVFFEVTVTRSDDGGPYVVGEVSAAAAPRLVPDTLGECPFPPESDAARVDTAVVVLQIEVAPSGRVVSARVLSDPGYGFGAAAQKRALRATYRPARDATGAAAPGSTRLRVRFERAPPTR